MYHQKNMLTTDPNLPPVPWSNWKRRQSCMSALQSGSVDKGDLQPQNQFPATHHSGTKSWWGKWCQLYLLNSFICSLNLQLQSH